MRRQMNSVDRHHQYCTPTHCIAMELQSGAQDTARDGPALPSSSFSTQSHTSRYTVRVNEVPL